MESFSVSSVKSQKTDDEEAWERPTIKFVNIIFLPFHPIFKFCILITVIMKCFAVSSYQRRYFNNNGVVPITRNECLYISCFNFNFTIYERME